MADPPRHASPTTALISRLMRIVRTCPEATADVLELVLLVSQIEALTAVDRDYRDAKRVIARLRHPLWDMTPDQRAVLRRAADTIREACGLAESDIPPDPIGDAGERDRIEAQLALALAGEFTPAQIAKVTGSVMAVLQASGERAGRGVMVGDYPVEGRGYWIWLGGIALLGLFNLFVMLVLH